MQTDVCMEGQTDMTKLTATEYVSICFDSQAALKTLQAIRTTSPLVQQCPKVLTISLPGMWWGCTGSLDMLEYKVMRSPISLQGAALFWGFLDPSRPWESPDRIYKGLVVGQPALGTMARSW